MYDHCCLVRLAAAYQKFFALQHSVTCNGQLVPAPIKKQQKIYYIRIIVTFMVAKVVRSLIGVTGVSTSLSLFFPVVCWK